jgi:hypothetical protein
MHIMHNMIIEDERDDRRIYEPYDNSDVDVTDVILRLGTLKFTSFGQMSLEIGDQIHHQL